LSELVLLKLGGSVITLKDKPLRANMEAIERLSTEISKSGVKKLVIVHGGGSYGHPLAKKYSLVEGFRNAGQLRGLCETHLAMLTLNRLIVEALLERGVAAAPVSPLSCAVTRRGRLVRLELSPVKRLLELGVVPVLFGDVVMDEELGFTILSGDQLIAALSMELNADRIVLGLDVDGLCDKDPKQYPDAELIEEISPEELERLLPGLGGSGGIDVTGGMRGKMAEMLAPAKRGIPVFLVNAAKPGLVLKALRGESTPGTLIACEGRRSR